MAPRRNKITAQDDANSTTTTPIIALPTTPQFLEATESQCGRNREKKASRNKEKEDSKKTKATRSSSRLNAIISPSRQTRAVRKARNVAIADCQVEKARVAHLVQTYKDAKYKPCC
ncbi:hypothetical protein ACA910_007639 [Epithemia clementina (nom. ined.)]